MMYPSFTYNGKRKPGVAVMEKSRPYWAPRNREILEIEGMPGGYLSDTKIGTLVITAKLLVTADSPFLLRRLAEEIPDWFNVNSPAPLIFDDETERTYYAVVDGALDPDEIVSFGFLPVTFLCPDPHKYGLERSVMLTDDVQIVDNIGTAETKPIFRCVAKSSITNIDIVTQQGYMRVGAPPAIEYDPVPFSTSVYASELTSTAGWSVAQTVDNGHVAGTMSSDGQGFVATGFGATIAPTGWQGPAVTRALTQPLQDFITQVKVRQFNGVNQLGMIEVYMLDAGGNVVGKMGIEDVWRYSKVNQAKFQLGRVNVDRWERHGTSEYVPAWNDFIGVMQLRRNGIAWDAYFAEVDSKGKHYNVENWRYWDYEEKYNAPVAQIVIALRKWGDAAVPQTSMRVERAEIWRINDTAPQSPLYIAHAGDVIEINHMTGDITINGEPRLWLKDFGSSFFPLVRGENTITVSPAHLVDVEMVWREKFG